jgi:DNA-binding NarL/FixJ family response regulator
MLNGLNTILQNGGGIDSIENSKNETELFLKLNSSTFDLLIIDPLVDGYFSVESIKKIKTKFPEVKILIISDTSSSEDVFKILENGIEGFLTRQCDNDEITHSIFAVAKGEKFYCNKVLDIILNKQFSPEEENCEPTTLTERETEIAGLIAKGLTNKEIGEQLHLSHHTVHSHRKNIFKKLSIKSVSELTLYAMNVGLITS